MLPVLSGSMGPTIVPGCSVRIERIAPRGTYAGDLVVFWDGEGLVAHRQLLRVRLGSLTVIYQKGDANPLGSWIREERIIGVVTEAIEPSGKRVYTRKRSAGRREARRQLRQVLRYPFHRVVRFLRRLFSGRLLDDGSQP